MWRTAVGIVCLALALFINMYSRKQKLPIPRPGPADDPAGSLELRYREAERDFARSYLRARGAAERRDLANVYVFEYLKLTADGASPPELRAAEPLLRRCLATNPDREVRAQVGYSLARHLMDRSDRGPVRLPLERARRAADEAAALFERVAREYGDVASFGKPFGVLAGDDLDELRHVGVGRPAPEIVGEDVDGRPLRLSDFRGKVVLLSFWAVWCPLCRGTLPYERSLVERLRGKPFVLLGVNGDALRNRPRQLAARGEVTWRCWFDGGDNGPIARAWHVRPWPAVFLIDARGVIRYRRVRRRLDEAALDEAIDLLVAEVGVEG
ncbi:MAG TPA: TlpA disulfide reductase family protein [Isosphaeraceae bacterium]|nr:TlpA disulfide reductase family protein [Isosphaeraceae bacterium]